MIDLKTKVPQTLNEAIERVVSSLTSEERKYIETSDQHGVHHTVGRAMRNSWNLWDKNSPINQDIQKRFGLFGHGDDCSGLIFDGVWASVRGQNVDEVLQKTAQRYIKHWRSYGIDPKTGKSRIT